MVNKSAESPSHNGHKEIEAKLSDPSFLEGAPHELSAAERLDRVIPFGAALLTKVDITAGPDKHSNCGTIKGNKTVNDWDDDL
jgi:hypothetical protein